jgi:hypothetical protein
MWFNPFFDNPLPRLYPEALFLVRKVKNPLLLLEQRRLALKESEVSREQKSRFSSPDLPT